MDQLYSSELPYWFWLILLWTGVWKGFALWRAARNESVSWFVALLILNTLGILEILYLYVFSKKQKNTK